MSAHLQFTQLEPEKEYDIGEFIITEMEENHPGKSYGYCVKKGNKKIVYSTDSEHKENADLLIFDT